MTPYGAPRIGDVNRGALRCSPQNSDQELPPPVSQYRSVNLSSVKVPCFQHEPLTTYTQVTPSCDGI